MDTWLVTAVGRIEVWQIVTSASGGSVRRSVLGIAQLQYPTFAG
ncbi:hypothetical protein [Streptomyces yunnanensis]|nr:hypothetical protein [Streptomyces yunnanensis]